MSKQITFGKPIECTHLYPDGTQERVRYGHFESILIVKENGWDALRTKILGMPRYCVEEVELVNGTKIIFDKPFIEIHEEYYGDNSGRKAKSIKELKNEH